VEQHIKSYRDLSVWQKTIILADAVYDATENFPQKEIYGLSSQHRRSAVSVASNVAEGSVRGNKEFIHFINIARGSLAELETQLTIAKRRLFLAEVVYSDMMTKAEEISRMLMGLMKSLKRVSIDS
jgi:four helix bundle protein